MAVLNRPDKRNALVNELLRQPAPPLGMTVDALRPVGRAVSAPETAWADRNLLRWSLQERPDPLGARLRVRMAARLDRSRTAAPGRRVARTRSQTLAVATSAPSPSAGSSS